MLVLELGMSGMSIELWICKSAADGIITLEPGLNLAPLWMNIVDRSLLVYQTLG
jgi:hypothetical protein